MVGTAYGMIGIGSTGLRVSISDIVQGLPLMPKTPLYIFSRSVQAAKQMKQFSLDGSLATGSLGSGGIMGIGSQGVDLALKGKVAYANKNNIVSDMNLTMKDLNIDFRSKENKAYFKINQLPPGIAALVAVVGMPASLVQKFINKWMYVDLQPLQTEVRKMIVVQSNVGDIDEIVNNLETAMRDKQLVLPTTITDETIDGQATYKMHTTIDKKSIDTIEKVLTKNKRINNLNYMVKTSDLINGLELTQWIDKTTYYTRKFSLSFKVKPQSSSSLYPPVIGDQNSFSPSLLEALTKKDVPVSIVMRYFDINKPVVVTVPANAVRAETYFQQVIEEFAKEPKSSGSAGIVDPVNMLAKANNVNRESDLKQVQTALELYRGDHQSYPPGITTDTKEISKTGADICAYIVPALIRKLPVDPLINTGKGIDDCTSNYATGYTVSLSPIDQNSVILSASYAELGEKVVVSR